MNRYNWKCGVFSRVCLILVYTSFYLVQLSVYAHQESQVSFFSGNDKIHHSYKGSNASLKKEARNQSKTVSFRLNKRFQPEHLFTIPQALPDLVNYSVIFHVVLFNAMQPPANIAFSFPSLRDRLALFSDSLNNFFNPILAHVHFPTREAGSLYRV